MYSFIKPRKKELIQYDTKLWLIFILATTLILTIFFIILKIEIYSYKKENKVLLSQIKQTNYQISKLKNELKFIKTQKETVKSIEISNKLLKNSIKNLFNLIPNQVVLTKVKITKNTLILYGKTINKDIYYYLLEPPLKSIFTTTKVDFYQTNNGWYNFVSINTLDDKMDNQ